MVGRDFDRVPEGGCSKPCDARLKCGHVCGKMCHSYDKDHVKYECLKPCPRKVCNVEGHRCPRKCYQTCGDCMTPVWQMLARCHHRQPVPCSVSVEDYRCRDRCKTRLACGHLCANQCGDDCTKQCMEKVKKPLPCGHDVELRCFEEPLAKKCTQPCDAALDCGHVCTGTCGRCLQGRLHQSCTSHCGRVLVCGHQCEVNCTRDCPPCSKACENRCVHSRCGRRCGDRCAPCQEPCEWVCEHKQCTRLCHEPCDRGRCNKPYT